MSDKKIDKKYLMGIDDILKKETEKRILHGENGLVALKNSIFDVTFNLISLVEEKTCSIDDFGVMLDKIDKYSDLGLIGKVIFYNKYINTIIDLFNKNNKDGMKFINYTIPEYKSKSEIKAFGSEIIFIHGYNNEISVKDDVILLFDYIDKNYIMMDNNIKVKK